MLVVAFASQIHAFAEGGSDQGVSLKDTLTWVLGLPALISTAVASVYVVRKSRLENEKAELEIQKLRVELGATTPPEPLPPQGTDSNVNQPPVTRIISETVVGGRVLQLLVVRFIFLYLLLQVWNILGSIFDNRLLPFIAIVPRVGYAAIIVLLGWPLLLDCARALRINIPATLRSAWVQWVLVVFALLSAVASDIGLFY